MLATFSTVLLKVTEMTTTLQVQAQQTIADNVLKNTYLLIEALKDNYRNYAINGHKNSIRRAKRGENVDYHLVRIKELKNGDCSIDYQVETGKKYHKVVFIDGGGSRSVHAFIDKQTGGVFKSASWRSPAKGERYNLLLIKDREWLFENADWSGGYLYAK
jgi:hypothetical protein